MVYIYKNIYWLSRKNVNIQMQDEDQIIIPFEILITWHSKALMEA